MESGDSYWWEGFARGWETAAYVYEKGVETLEEERDRLRAELAGSEREHEKSLAIMEAALDDRDTWRQRWQQLMRDHEEAVTERDRLAAALDRVREALAGHPRCEKYAGDDPITCGWKKAVLDVQAAIEGTDS